MNRTGDSLSKKCLALLLAACLLAPALTGCQRLAEEAPGASEEETTSETAPAQDEDDTPLPQDENGAGLSQEDKASGEVELEADDKLSAAAPDSSEEESAEGPEAEAELTGEQPAQEVDTTPQTQQPASQTGAHRR